MRLVADRNHILANRNDLAYITVEVVDNAGNFIPDAGIKVHLAVTGDGEMLASGNAAPNDMESFHNIICKTYNGRCMAIIRPFTKAGSIKVSAEAEGLPQSSVEIEAK